MENQEIKHKRRVRYSGTHPKSYKEKYKEHNPEKYADVIEKVIQKGSTPAGMHISIMVQEILNFLQIKPGQTGLDATLGYGGHTKAMLQCLNGEGHIYALDVDPIKSAERRKHGKPIETTTQFREAIEEALCKVPGKERAEAVKKSCQRSFQALRIDVNSEFEVLYAFLDKLPQVLAPNGRVAILTFHSGEDRLVKRSFKELQKAGIYSEISKDVIRPSSEECIKNPRARSTKMRWAIKATE